MFGGCDLTATTLPYLHHNARSRRIPSREIREVYIEDLTRGLPAGIDKSDYVRKVMP